jgi:predicted amidohydrolase
VTPHPAGAGWRKRRSRSTLSPRERAKIRLPKGQRREIHSQIIDYEGRVLAEAGETEETIISAEVDLAAADRNRVVRVPGQYEFDRIASRRPEMYAVITEPKNETQ